MERPVTGTEDAVSESVHQARVSWNADRDDLLEASIESAASIAFSEFPP